MRHKYIFILILIVVLMVLYRDLSRDILRYLRTQNVFSITILTVFSVFYKVTRANKKNRIPRYYSQLLLAR